MCLGAVPPWWESDADANGVHPYPMDYYARDGGEWNSSYHKTRPGRRRGAQLSKEQDEAQKAAGVGCDCRR